METRLAAPELIAPLRRLMFLRWGAMVLLALFAIAAQPLLNLAVRTDTLLLLAGAVALYNTAFILLASPKGGQPVAPRLARLIVNAQISFDVLALTALLYFSGGLSNPIYLYYLLPGLIASVLLSRAETAFHIVFALAAFGAIVILELQGLIPPASQGSIAVLAPTGKVPDAEYALGIWLAMVSVLILTGLLGTSAASLFNAGRQGAAGPALSTQERPEHVGNLSRATEIERERIRYLGRASHEMRAPLATIESMLLTVRSGYAGELPEKCGELLDRAVERAHDLQAMISDLLVLDTAGSMQAFSSPGLFEPRAQIEEVVERFALEANAKGIDMSCDLPPALPALPGDSVGLRHILTNLVSNAVRYTEQGGEIVISAEPRGSDLQIVVSDTGIGIEQQELTKVFDEFYRSEQSRKMVKDGTGLGLAIVQAIVNAYHGRISIESEPGRGTTVTVSLPLASPAERESARSSQPPTSERQQKGKAGPTKGE